MAVIGSPDLLARFQGVGSVSTLKAVVVWNVASRDALDESLVAGTGVDVYTWDEFMALGGDVSEEAVDERIAAQKPGHCCTLIYTSGTTGTPKAVMISHDNATWTGRVTMECLSGTHGDSEVSYLPLSHIAAQMLDVHGPMQAGIRIYFAFPDALKGTLPLTLKAVKPTIFFGVPRVWEKFYAALSRLPASVPNAAKHGGVGLEKCRAAYTGAAPISREVLEFFSSIDLPVLEVFGQSECTGPQALSTPAESKFGLQYKLGWAGVAFPGSEQKIVAETQEVVYRGRHIMMGYMKNPEKSAEAIDEEGFLHSGDQGEIDEEGYLRITGRIKELIITAGGENIAPVPIEKAIKAALPCVSNAVVIGDRKKFLSVLLTLKTKPDENAQPSGNELFAEALATSESLGSEAKTTEEAIADAKWSAHLDAGIAKANESAVSRAATIKKWVVLPRDFTVMTGELGPTLKLKRPVVHKKQAEVIDGLYKAMATPFPLGSASEADAAATSGSGAGAGAGAGAGTGSAAAPATAAAPKPVAARAPAAPRPTSSRSTSVRACTCVFVWVWVCG